MKTATTLGAAALAALMALSMTACGAASTNAGTPGRYNNTAGSSYGTAYNGTEPYRYSPVADNKSSVKQRVNQNNTGADISRAVRDTAGDMKQTARKIADGVTDTGRDIVGGMTAGVNNAGVANNASGTGVAGRNTVNNTLSTGTAQNPNLTGISGMR